MDKGLWALMVTAGSIGLVHTLIGPDHYLPFIMMAWSRKWSRLKTAMITLACGLGHVLSSVVLGMVGIAMGIAVGQLEGVEGKRGDIAGWMLLAFGLAYAVWGIHRALANKVHSHPHLHGDNHDSHQHEHAHDTAEHMHPHGEQKKHSITPWVLFAIFVFGPCEPLIPILMYPAAKSSWAGAVAVAIVFSFFTIGTMMTIVMLGTAGINFLPMKKLERYTHAIGGVIIFLCGLAIMIGL